MNRTKTTHKLPSSTESSTSETAAGDGEDLSVEVQEQIRRRAYELYEQDGMQEGRAEEHWLEAEREILGTLPPE